MNQVWPRHTMRTMSLQTAQAAGFTMTERANRLSRDYPLAELMAENNSTAYVSTVGTTEPFGHHKIPLDS